MRRDRFADWDSHLKDRNSVLRKEYEDLVQSLEAIPTDAEHYSSFPKIRDKIVDKIMDLRTRYIRTLGELKKSIKLDLFVVKDNNDKYMKLVFDEIVTTEHGRKQLIRVIKNILKKTSDEQIQLPQ